MNSAIATTIGQTITLTTIISEVSTRLPMIPPHSVLSAGALGLERLSPDATCALATERDLEYCDLPHNDTIFGSRRRSGAVCCRNGVAELTEDFRRKKCYWQ